VDSVYQHVLAWREALEEAGIELAVLLLRPRRVRRTAGLNPDEARGRDEKTVEGYTA
jgi:hypothetical protein